MKKPLKRLLTLLFLSFVTAAVFAVPAFASGDVAGAVEQTWTTAQTQIKEIVNKVVFPVIDLILAVLFFVKVGTAYFEYRKHGQFEFGATRF